MSEDNFIQVSQSGSVSVIVFTKKCKLIEEAILEPVGSALSAALAVVPMPCVVLDLSNTEFFGSGFIEVLLRSWRELQQRSGSHMVLCGVQTYCREVLQITHLDQLWPIVETREAAIELASAG
jgi:anti-sigma B factor antagonist